MVRSALFARANRHRLVHAGSRAHRNDGSCAYKRACRAGVFLYACQRLPDPENDTRHFVPAWTDRAVFGGVSNPKPADRAAKDACARTAGQRGNGQRVRFESEVFRRKRSRRGRNRAVVAADRRDDAAGVRVCVSACCFGGSAARGSHCVHRRGLARVRAQGSAVEKGRRRYARMAGGRFFPVEMAWFETRVAAFERRVERLFGVRNESKAAGRGVRRLVARADRRVERFAGNDPEGTDSSGSKGALAQRANGNDCPRFENAVDGCVGIHAAFLAGKRRASTTGGCPGRGRPAARAAGDERGAVRVCPFAGRGQPARPDRGACGSCARGDDCRDAGAAAKKTDRAFARPEADGRDGQRAGDGAGVYEFAGERGEIRSRWHHDRHDRRANGRV